MALRWLVAGGVFLASCWKGVECQVAGGAPAPAAADMHNAMANTYGFLRTSSDKVGTTVSSLLGIEGSLEDSYKDLNEEYKRWIHKKKVLLKDQEKQQSEIDRLKGELEEQKKMREEKKRVEGETTMREEENDKQNATNIAEEARRVLEKQAMEEEIQNLIMMTENIQRIKQERVDAANNKTAYLKDENRGLQQEVFDLNKDVLDLEAEAAKNFTANKEIVSNLLSEVEAMQNSIHALEKQLIAQAQLEEEVQRSRERLAAQTAEVVRQRQKLTDAKDKCDLNKKRMTDEIEGTKGSLNSANKQMSQCQDIDASNQKLQAELNECLLRKRSER